MYVLSFFLIIVCVGSICLDGLCLIVLMMIVSILGVYEIRIYPNMLVGIMSVE